jgi:hypothetical protein
MNQQTDRTSVPTTHTITPHLVVGGAARAADWYQQAFGAQLGDKIPVPGGKFIQIEVRLGDSVVMLADEFPEMGAVAADAGRDLRRAAHRHRGRRRHVGPRGRSRGHGAPAAAGHVLG